MNVLDDPAASFVVLTNDGQEHSLWPSALDPPLGWRVMHTGGRIACLEYIDRAWTVGPARPVEQAK